MNAAEYERMYRLEDSYWWFVGRRRFVESLLRRWSGKEGAAAPMRTILDVGCGTGAMSAMLSNWGRVVSADFSPLALEFSRRRGLQPVLGADAMKMPFAGEVFHVIVAMDVLEHLPEDRKALREFYRVLKPGGRLFATVPAYPHLWSEHDVALMHHRRYVRSDATERLAEAGFHIEKLSYTMSLLYPIVALNRRLNARRPPHDPPQAILPLLPSQVNAMLTTLVGWENSISSRANLPFGLTLAAVARK